MVVYLYCVLFTWLVAFVWVCRVCDFRLFVKCLVSVYLWIGCHDLLFAGWFTSIGALLCLSCGFDLLGY